MGPKKKNSERNSRGKSKKKNEIARLFYGHVPTLSPIVVEAEQLNATTTNKKTEKNGNSVTYGLYCEPGKLHLDEKGEILRER